MAERVKFNSLIRMINVKVNGKAISLFVQTVYLEKILIDSW